MLVSIVKDMLTDQIQNLMVITQEMVFVKWAVIVLMVPVLQFSVLLVLTEMLQVSLALMLSTVCQVMVIACL